MICMGKAEARNRSSYWRSISAANAKRGSKRNLHFEHCKIMKWDRMLRLLQAET